MPLLNKTKIHEFEYKSQPGVKNIGIIADDNKGTPLSPDGKTHAFMNTIGLLIKAVQELTDEIESLKARIEELES